MTAPIVIQNYNPLWPTQFETLRSRLATALDSLAAAIEHIGSTAVPRLAAKPVIDIDVLLRSSADFASAAAQLRALGYDHQGDLGVAGREAFRPPATDIPHHLYVHSPGSREFARHIAFRDHLRCHPETADAYARLKRNLAAKFAADRETYTQAKSGFIEAALQKL